MEDVRKWRNRAANPTITVSLVCVRIKCHGGIFNIRNYPSHGALSVLSSRVIIARVINARHCQLNPLNADVLYERLSREKSVEYDLIKGRREKRKPGSRTVLLNMRTFFRTTVITITQRTSLAVITEEIVRIH